MKKTRLLLLVLLGIGVLLAACQPISAPASSASPAQVGQVIKVDNGSYRDLSAKELDAQMQAKDFTLVNVHIPFAGNLPKTDISIPYDTIAQNLDKLPADKNSKIVLYCRSGSMSTIASKELVKLGYTNIFNLSGGMNAWEENGFTLEK